MKNCVFALDIGTQSVTGILLKQYNNSYKVIDFCIRQHKERSMLDGQIQNVIQVADVILEVKEELEKNYGPLKKVCVAAAGRALKTVQAEKTISIHEQPIQTLEEVKHLEISAVQNALIELTKNDKQQFAHYHCVGYSVLHYKLDGDKIGSFIDQTGEEATVEIIATFLPKVVVESLLAALERANLTIAALTLEPIAAIHVLVPESMRRLNVALIDIGAGTSDIAISNNGTVVAYGMVPTAGDEITEAISDHYLLDFKVAEETKRKVINEQQTTVHNILGVEYTITYDELVPELLDSVDQIAHSLANEIRLLNGKAPQAIMLIGGGSLTPKIDEKIASYLQMPTNRVAVRGIEAIQQLEKDESLPTGPDFVTPIGIAISATQNPLQYITVYVNGKVTFMFETKQLTVGDSLIQAGIDMNTYYGKIGLAAIVTVNGETITLRGEYGEPPKIYVNGKRTSVDHNISSGDKIVIQKGKDGKQPNVTIGELVDINKEIPFYYNNEKYYLTSSYVVNGQEVDPTYIVQDNDDIVIRTVETIHDFLHMMNDKQFQKPKFFSVIVNDQTIEIKEGNPTVLLNDKAAKLSTPIRENDVLSIEHAKKVTVKTLLHQLHKPNSFSIKVTFNGKPVELKQQLISIQRHNELLKEDTELQHGDILTLTEKKVRPFIFQDIFRHVDINLTNKTGTYHLYCNNELIGFHDEIKHGDELNIKWK